MKIAAPRASRPSSARAGRDRCKLTGNQPERQAFARRSGWNAALPGDNSAAWISSRPRGRAIGRISSSPRCVSALAIAGSGAWQRRLSNLDWLSRRHAPPASYPRLSRPIALRSFEGTRARGSGPGRRCPPTARGSLRRHTCLDSRLRIPVPASKLPTGIFAQPRRAWIEAAKKIFPSQEIKHLS
jgi:hypothetical protein